MTTHTLADWYPQSVAEGVFYRPTTPSHPSLLRISQLLTQMSLASLFHIYVAACAHLQSLNHESFVEKRGERYRGKFVHPLRAIPSSPFC